MLNYSKPVYLLIDFIKEEIGKGNKDAKDVLDLWDKRRADKKSLNYFLGISTGTWEEIKDLIDDHFNGDIDRFLNFHVDSANQIDRLTKEITDMKLPRLNPVIFNAKHCGSFDAWGHKCSGGAASYLDEKKWCLQCKCYDPR